MCLEALRNANLLPSSPEPIRIERFIEKHFGCRIFYEDLGAGVMGCTAFRNDGKVECIIVSSNLDDGGEASERRVRTTLAHESGHGLMHANLFIRRSEQSNLALGTEHHENLDFKKRRILCRGSDIAVGSNKNRYDGRWWEWQANRAISGFLLPARLVHKAAAPFLNSSPVTNSRSMREGARFDAERALAQIFDVNPVVARIRLWELFPGDSGQMEF